jgi:hypothetical protein
MYFNSAMCVFVAEQNGDLFPAGASVPKKDIIDVIKKFNIQINNLTQVCISASLFLHGKKRLYLTMIAVSVTSSCRKIGFASLQS